MNRNNIPSSSRGGAAKRSTRGNNRFNPYNGIWNNRSSGPREKPTLISIPSYTGGPAESVSSSTLLTTPVCPSSPQPIISFMLDKTPGSYPGWKLYFPIEGKN